MNYFGHDILEKSEFIDEICVNVIIKKWDTCGKQPFFISGHRLLQMSGRYGIESRITFVHDIGSEFWKKPNQLDLIKRNYFTIEGFEIGINK